MYCKAVMAKLLLGKGADIDTKNCIGRTPLHNAVMVGSDAHALVSLLLNAGASVHARDKQGCTALHLVSDGGVAELLLEHGAALTVIDNSGRTPLHQATNCVSHLKQGYTADSLVWVLLGHGARKTINIQDDLGRTALHNAVHIENKSVALAIVLMLLATRDLDKNLPDTFGKTALDYAIGMGKRFLIQPLLENKLDEGKFTPGMY
jgi:ankyrin repeat protein